MIDEGFAARAAILVVVALLITLIVYGVVALIVKMDDFGLHLAESESSGARTIGTTLVRGMPKLLAWLSTIGTAAMLWVGGHILLVGADELGWHWPYEQVHHLEEDIHHTVSGLGAALAWCFNTFVSAIIGIVVGGIVLAVVHRFTHDQHTANKH